MKSSIVSFLAMLIASSTLLAVTPAIASDYTLEVFGNANMDETIDEDDVAYVEGIIDGTNEDTELADANYDGQVDERDIAQIELIMRGEEDDLTIIDESGKIITIKEPVERVVICHAMFAEVLRSLRTEDRIVGIPSYMADYVVFYPELSKLPTIGGASTPDSEAIVSLNPDLVIVYGTWADNLENDLKDVAPVIRLTYRPFSTTEKDITTLGYIVGKENEAEELIQFFEQPLSTVQENVATLSDDEKPRVYSEYTDYRTHAKGSGLHDVLIMAGGINIASDITTDASSVPFIDPEWVIAQNPDIIVRRALKSDASCGYDEDDPTQMKALRDNILNRSETANVTAIKNGDVYCYSTDILTGSNYWIGILYMAKLLHPDLFEDLDPQAIHQEYLTRFQRLDYDLDEHGIFFYPPLEMS